MQAESIAAARGVGREHVSVLDVGCGNSPLLFTLSETHSLRNLVGVDFCDKAIARCKEYSTANGFDPDDPSFKVMDATAMAEFADASFDVLCDKGCLGERHYMRGSPPRLDRSLSLQILSIRADQGERLRRKQGSRVRARGGDWRSVRVRRRLI